MKLEVNYIEIKLSHLLIKLTNLLMDMEPVDSIINLDYHTPRGTHHIQLVRKSATSFVEYHSYTLANPHAGFLEHD
jgi:hypothetical protein